MSSPSPSPPPPPLLCYIAMPYRAASPWEVEQNIRRAEKLGLALARQGFMPVIPHTMMRFFNGVEGVLDDFWLLGTMRLMEVADLLILGPGWLRSKGARTERERWLSLPPTKLGKRISTCIDTTLFGCNGEDEVPGLDAFR